MSLKARLRAIPAPRRTPAPERRTPSPEANRGSLPAPLRGVLAAIALGVVYFLVAYLSITEWSTETALLWPASGLYLGVLLASDRRNWPQLAVAVLAGSFAANLLGGNSPAVSLSFAVPGCAEGLLGAVIVLRIAEDRFTLERTRDLLALLVGAAIVANALTALSAAAAAVQAFDAPLGESWLRWWSADALGIVAVAPMVVLALRSRLGRPRREQLDQVAFSVVFLAAVVVAFSMAEPPAVAAVVAGMLGFALLLWAGWRWSLRSVTTLTGILAIAITYIASREATGFVSSSISTADKHIVQAYLATLIMASLSAAVLAAERNGEKRALGRSRERLRKLVQTAPDAYVSVGEDQRIAEWSPRAEAVFGWPRSEVLGRSLQETIVPDDQRDAWKARLNGGSAALESAPLTAKHRSGAGLDVELIRSSPEDDQSTLHLFIRDVSERERARAELLSARELVERRGESLDEADRKIERLGADLRERADQVERAEREHARLQSELEESRRDVEQTSTLLAEARKENAAGAAELQARVQEIQALAQELHAGRGELKALRDELAGAQAAREATVCDLEAAGAAREETERRLAAIEGKLDAARRRSERMQRELEEARTEHALLRAKLFDSEARADTVRRELERTQERFSDERARLERALEDAQAVHAEERGRLERTLLETEQRHDAERARLDQALLDGEQLRAGDREQLEREAEQRQVEERARLERRLQEADERHIEERARLERTIEEAEEHHALERARLERSLAESAELLAEADDERLLLARRGTELIARYDARGICLYASPACRQLVGFDPDELVGRQGAELLLREDLPLLNRARAAQGDSTFRARLRRKDGTLTAVEATFSPVREVETGRLVEIEATLRPAPVSLQQPYDREHTDASAELRPLADRDPLTGLFTRSRFEEELRGQVSGASRYGTVGAVLAVNLDRFRELNGLLGHSCTDDLLRGVAHAFRARLRTTDVLGRTGDDQFAVALPRAEAPQALEVANALLEAVREVGRKELGTGSMRLTASIGVASFGDGRSVSAEELLVEAEIAVQDAKHSGGDSVASYDASEGPTVEAGERFAWTDHIRAALAEDRLILYAEPVASLTGDPLVRHELLPRMIGAGGELVPAAAFLSAASRAGLAADIDRWLLRRAIQVLAAEQRAGGDARLEVALSAKGGIDAKLADFVADELRVAGADARGLSLAIPETAALRGGGSAGLALRRLSELGCEIGLDAFGTGLASFVHVEGLPVAYLKLDEGLVRRVRTSHATRLVARAIASIARGLGRRTVARSVPDRETLVLLRRLGVSCAQGPALGEPRPADEQQLSGRAKALS